MSRSRLIHGLIGLSAAALTTGAMAPGAQAADLLAPAPMAAPAPEPLVEWGSGWYLRGDIGLADDKRDPMMRMPGKLSSTSATSAGVSGDLGFGYQFGEMFRADLTAGIRRPLQQDLRSNHACLVGIGPPSVFDACTAGARVSVSRLPIMANAYVDLGTFGGLRPYIGAGVGAAIVTARYNRHEVFSDGVNTYGFAYTDPATGRAVNLSNEFAGKSTRVNFAYALMAGVSYDIMDGFAVDVGYRYMNMGKVNIPGATTGARLASHEARIGLRYRID